MYVQLPGTPPRHGDIDNRAEEEEDDELGEAALHDIILRLDLPSPYQHGQLTVPSAPLY